jgi:type III secretion protein U
MSQSAGEKTHQPTRKRLRDARKEGQVAHSQDLTRTVTLALGALMLSVGAAGASARLAALAEQSWALARTPSLQAMLEFGLGAGATLAWVSVAVVGLLAAGGALTAFLQVGALFAPKRITPDFKHLNPAQGLQRIFSLNNAVEALKAIVKTAVLLGVFVVLFKSWLPDLMRLPAADIATAGAACLRPLVQLLGVVAAVFALVALADLQWQRYNHLRQLRMTLDEVRREHKEQDGDPQLKGQRRQLQRRWAAQDLVGAAKRAAALVVNPTHIAVAIEFDAHRDDVPIVTAKGHGRVAGAMRAAAAEAGVPIVRNVALARALDHAAEIEDPVPEELFDAVAEVLVWAQQLRQQQQQHAADATATTHRPPPEEKGPSS